MTKSEAVAALDTLTGGIKALQSSRDSALAQLAPLTAENAELKTVVDQWVADDAEIDKEIAEALSALNETPPVDPPVDPVDPTEPTEDPVP